MAHSDAVYVIHDKLLGADVYSFMAQHDGIAQGNFQSFCNHMQRTEFSLHRIAGLEFFDQQLVVVDITRNYVCDANPSFLVKPDENFEA